MVVNSGDGSGLEDSALDLLSPSPIAWPPTVDVVGVTVVVDGSTCKQEQALERARPIDVSATASRWIFENHTDAAALAAAGVGPGARLRRSPRPTVVVRVSVAEMTVVTVTPEMTEVAVVLVVLCILANVLDLSSVTTAIHIPDGRGRTGSRCDQRN